MNRAELKYNGINLVYLWQSMHYTDALWIHSRLVEIASPLPAQTSSFPISSRKNLALVAGVRMSQ